MVNTVAGVVYTVRYTSEFGLQKVTILTCGLNAYHFVLHE